MEIAAPTAKLAVLMVNEGQSAVGSKWEGIILKERCKTQGNTQASKS